MHPLLRKVPRLNVLAVFEAAARTGSFTAAGNELGMTQPNVSRHIAQLEQQLGYPLFVRSANSIAPSPQGIRLNHEVAKLFDSLLQHLDSVAPKNDTIRLGVNPGLAEFWVLPHLDSLRQHLDAACVQISLFDRESELGLDSVDCAVHLAKPARFAGSIAFLDEEVLPVAAPVYATRHSLSARSSPDELRKHSLLHVDKRDREWLTWANYFALLGCEQVPGGDPQVQLNSYAMARHRALDGHGIALQWVGLADRHLADGTLTQVGPAVRRSDVAHCVTPGLRSDIVAPIAEWLARCIASGGSTALAVAEPTQA